MYTCQVIYKVGVLKRCIFNYQTKECPEHFSEQTWSNIIQLQKGYNKPVKVLNISWTKGSKINPTKDLNTDKQSIHTILENITQLTSCGLNAQEIVKSFKYVTKAKLIHVIMATLSNNKKVDYMKEPNIYAKGTPVLSREGTIKGHLTGGSRTCGMHGCTGRNLGVRWEDGKLTLPCTKGMSYMNASNTWKIL
jgi:hypothetical protein